MQAKFSAFELVPGRSYRVIAAFKDYDGSIHPVGEQWRYLSRNFLPYEDGLTLHIEHNGQKTLLRLQAAPETQGPIVDNFSSYVQEV